MALPQLKELMTALAKVTDTPAEVDNAALLPLLKKMHALSGVTREDLAATGAPKVVKAALKRVTNPDTIALGKACIAAWKQAVLKELAEDASPATSRIASPITGGRNAVETVTSPPSAASTPGAEGAPEGAVPVEKKNPPPFTPGTGVVLRDRGAGMLYKILWQSEVLPLTKVASEIATELEEALFKVTGGTKGEPEYKRKLTTLSSALKKNPDLGPAIMGGELSPMDVAQMPPQDLASKAVAEEREKIHADFKASRNPEKARPQATTDFFKCGRCKQRKCTYYQLQTRSADEPMTTFVTCTNCNNRWKFS